MRVTTPDPRGYPYPAVEKGDWLGAGSDDSRGILVVATCLSPFSTRCFPPHSCFGRFSNLNPTSRILKIISENVTGDVSDFGCTP